MNALIIGLGSAGNRHTGVLSKFGFDIFSVSTHLDSGKNNFHTVQDAMDSNDYEYVVITNETSKHQFTYDLVRTLGFKKKVLIEKPLNFKDIGPSTHLDSDAFVGFNLRYLPAVKYLREYLAVVNDEIIEVKMEYGNSTDNWRNGKNREFSYSRSIVSGGGVLRDFCHEIDLACWIFGVQELQFSYGNRMGEYMLDGEDFVKMIFSNNAKYLLEISLNSLQKIPSRTIRIVTHSRNIDINLLNGLITINDEVHRFENSIDQTYVDMHNDILNVNSESIATLQDGLLVDNIIRLAEEGMKQNRGKS